MTVLLAILGVVLVVLGIIGIVVPLLPGSPAVFLGLWCLAWADGFVHVGWKTIGVLGVLTVASFGIDFLVTSLGAKRLGASTLAVIGAAVGTVVGIFFGFMGILLGPFLGAFLGELLGGKSLKRAAKVGAGTWLGILIGTAAKIALVFVMIGTFVLVYAFG
jgi:hypothetical protein